jgi:hypothetical protein
MRKHLLHVAWSAGLIALTAAAAAACTVAGERASTSDNAVTSIPETPVLNQGQTGSCWLYATGAWVESLHTSANGSSIHYSPAYWTYWRFYDQLVSGRAASFGGYWGEAGDIIQRYGLMPLGSFVIDDVASALAAIAKVNAKIRAGFFGPLAPADAGPLRRNPVLVRAALDEAFGLGNDVRAQMNTTFGVDGQHTFRQGVQPSGGMIRAQDLDVQTVVAGNPTIVKLDQVFGAWHPGGHADDRDGDTAWTAAYPPVTPNVHPILAVAPGEEDPFPGQDPLPDDANDAGALATAPAPPGQLDPAAWRAFTKRIQKALNDGVPVPMAFSAMGPNIDSKGVFHASAPVISPALNGHEVLLSDYEAINVPSYGTLPLGSPADSTQKHASLDDNASVSIFRVKNSWGTSGFHAVAGYNDIEIGYLQQPIQWCKAVDGGQQCAYVGPQMWDVVLPPGY